MLLRHVWNMVEVMMSIGISSMSGSWSVDLIGSVIFHYVWWRWEDVADRVVSWFGWKKGLQKPTKCCFSIFRNMMRCTEYAVSKDLSHVVPNANTLVAGKQNSSFNLIQSPLALPAIWSYQIFASPVRENGESFTIRCIGLNGVWLNSSKDSCPFS